jgi:hypothetical protein
LKQRYKELEEIVNGSFPGLIEGLKEGKRIVYLREDMFAIGLTVQELAFFGAVGKVTAKYGSTVIFGDYMGVVVTNGLVREAPTLGNTPRTPGSKQQ